MALRPDDLERKSFTTSRRGYDQAQVRAYLYSLANAIRFDERERQIARQSGAASGAQQDAKEIIAAAQQTAESIRAEARRQADDIRTSARRDAQRYADDAAAEAVADGKARWLPEDVTGPAPATKPSLASVATLFPGRTPDHLVDPNNAAMAVEDDGLEARLDEKRQQLETLRAQIQRLHEESGAAVRTATDERRAAERVRAESIEEISRVRAELTALQAQAGHVGITGGTARLQPPGSVRPRSAHIDTRNITVVDSSAAAESPLVDAVKSAVGRAIGR